MKALTAAVVLSGLLMLFPQSSRADGPEDACVAIAAGVAAVLVHSYPPATAAQVFSATVLGIGYAGVMNQACADLGTAVNDYQATLLSDPAVVEYLSTPCLLTYCPSPPNDGNSIMPISDGTLPVDCRHQLMIDCVNDFLINTRPLGSTPNEFINALTFLQISSDSGYWATAQYGYLIGIQTEQGPGGYDDPY